MILLMHYFNTFKRIKRIIDTLIIIINTSNYYHVIVIITNEVTTFFPELTIHFFFLKGSQ